MAKKWLGSLLDGLRIAAANDGGLPTQLAFRSATASKHWRATRPAIALLEVLHSGGAVADRLDRIARDRRLSDAARAEDSRKVAHEFVRGIALLATEASAARATRLRELEGELRARQTKDAAARMSAEDGRELRQLVASMPGDVRARMLRDAVGGRNPRLHDALRLADPAVSAIMLDTMADVDPSALDAGSAPIESYATDAERDELHDLAEVDAVLSVALTMLEFGLGEFDQLDPHEDALHAELRAYIVAARGGREPEPAELPARPEPEPEPADSAA